MKRLRFSKGYRKLVREGKKTQTIRCWKHPLLREGELCRSADVGVLEVTAVDEVELSDLSEEDARREGFGSVEELLKAIRRIYGNGRKGYSFYRIRFRVLPETDRLMSGLRISGR